jgi:hypothetical protein
MGDASNIPLHSFEERREMKELNEVEQAELVDILEIGKKLASSGHSIKHLTRNLRRADCVMYRICRQNGRFGFAVSKEDAEKYLLKYEHRPVRENKHSAPRVSESPEEQVRRQREQLGWVSLRLASPGMPDLVNLKPRGDGSFDVLFEEVKGLGDGIRKEQHAVLETMAEKGIPITVTWL